MLPVIFDSLRIAGAAVLCSAAVKLLDDYLDRELDAVSGQPNWINRLGEGSVAYSLPLLAGGVAMETAVALSLFLAAWAVGMYRDLAVCYPSRLRGWQEALLAIAAGVAFAGWRLMLCALLLAASIQAADDIVDRYGDQAAGRRNLAHRFGTIPCLGAALALGFSAWLAAPAPFWPMLGGIAAVYAASGMRRPARV
ncbi:MAG: hypothetical protein E6X17_03390 [Sporomusaceae bacterium]|nr:hypothetical protein [Sporomusaceae bacterium]